MKDAKKLAEFFHAMSAINRFSQFRLVNPESVLEHTGMVAITTMVLCDMIGAPERLQLEALRHALVHDVDEILTGDISNPTKYSSPESEMILAKVADVNMRKICEEYDFPYHQAWDHNPNSSVHIIVKLADTIAVFYKAYQEIELFGNKSMKDAIQQLIPALMRRHAQFIERFHSVLDVTDLCEDICETIRDLRSET